MSPLFPRPSTWKTISGGLRRWLSATGLVAIAMTAMAGSAMAADATVEMQDFDFDPQTVTIDVGDSVTWTNTGAAPHTATAQGEFDTGILNAGESDSVTFSEAGSFDYICTVHPQMTGTVVVEAAGTTEPSPTIGDPVTVTPAPTDTIDAAATSTGIPAILLVLTVLSGTAFAGTLAVVRLRNR